MGFLRRSYLEAAARLALWEEFDVKSFDAFCVRHLLLLSVCRSTGCEVYTCI